MGMGVDVTMHRWYIPSKFTIKSTTKISIFNTIQSWNICDKAKLEVIKAVIDALKSVDILHKNAIRHFLVKYKFVGAKRIRKTTRFRITAINANLAWESAC